MTKKNNFSDKNKIKALQCCDRHCCLCGKQCATNIEIHHIQPVDKNGTKEFDNAIPLCFDCHAKVEMYNEKHPKGLKYRYEELKTRRNQIYDKYTSPYLPSIDFKIISDNSTNTNPSDNPSKNPKLSRFLITNTHQYLPCKVKTTFSVYHQKKLLHKFDKGVYGGQDCWHLNANSSANVPPNFLGLAKNKKIPKIIKQLQVQIEVIVIDKFGWEHKLLPVSWIWTPTSKGWYYEPFSVK